MEILMRREPPKPIIVKLTVDGFIEAPASEIDADASYTFEYCYEGQWYRWTDQRPTIIGDRARFMLHDGTPIEEPRR